MEWKNCLSDKVHTKAKNCAFGKQKSVTPCFLFNYTYWVTHFCWLVSEERDADMMQSSIFNFMSNLGLCSVVCRKKPLINLTTWAEKSWFTLFIKSKTIFLLIRFFWKTQHSWMRKRMELKLFFISFIYRKRDSKLTVDLFSDRTTLRYSSNRILNEVTQYRQKR